MLLETRSGRHRQMPVRTTLEVEDRCQAVTWGPANYVITSFPLAGLLPFAVPPTHTPSGPPPPEITKYSSWKRWHAFRGPDTSFSEIYAMARRPISEDGPTDNFISGKTIWRRGFLLVSLEIAFCSRFGSAIAGACRGSSLSDGNGVLSCLNSPGFDFGHF